MRKGGGRRERDDPHPSEGGRGSSRRPRRRRVEGGGERGEREKLHLYERGGFLKENVLLMNLFGFT